MNTRVVVHAQRDTRSPDSARHAGNDAGSSIRTAIADLQEQRKDVPRPAPTPRTRPRGDRDPATVAAGKRSRISDDIVALRARQATKASEHRKFDTRLEVDVHAARVTDLQSRAMAGELDNALRTTRDTDVGRRLLRDARTRGVDIVPLTDADMREQHPGAGAVYIGDADNPTIKLSYSALADARRATPTIVHELVHAYADNHNVLPRDTGDDSAAAAQATGAISKLGLTKREAERLRNNVRGMAGSSAEGHTLTYTVVALDQRTRDNAAPLSHAQRNELIDRAAQREYAIELLGRLDAGAISQKDARAEWNTAPVPGLTHIASPAFVAYEAWKVSDEAALRRAVRNAR